MKFELFPPSVAEAMSSSPTPGEKMGAVHCTTLPSPHKEHTAKPGTATEAATCRYGLIVNTIQAGNFHWNSKSLDFAHSKFVNFNSAYFFNTASGNLNHFGKNVLRLVPKQKREGKFVSEIKILLVDFHISFNEC